MKTRQSAERLLDKELRALGWDQYDNEYIQAYSRTIEAWDILDRKALLNLLHEHLALLGAM